MAIGINIKKRLTELGWDQKNLVARLADLKLRVSQQNVSAIVRRDSSKSKHLVPIAQALWLRPDQLLSGNWPPLKPGEEPQTTLLAGLELPPEYSGDEHLKLILLDWSTLLEDQKKEIVREVQGRAAAVRTLAAKIGKRPTPLSDAETRKRLKLDQTEKKAPAARHRTKAKK